MNPAPRNTSTRKSSFTKEFMDSLEPRSVRVMKAIVAESESSYAFLSAPRENIIPIIYPPIDFGEISYRQEILFTKEKELMRQFCGKRLTYSFTGNQQRLKLFEGLLLIRDFASTENLRNLSLSPSDAALRVMIGSVNKDIARKLQLKTKIIEGRKGFGYRINPDIAIVEENLL